MIHVFAFTYNKLCPSSEPPLVLDVKKYVREHFIQGQWQEIVPQLEKVDCEVCKLIALIMQANKLEHLFNSNQRELAETLRKRMREAAQS
jgi:hypothetical protein